MQNAIYRASSSMLVNALRTVVLREIFLHFVISYKIDKESIGTKRMTAHHYYYCKDAFERDSSCFALKFVALLATFFSDL